MTKQDQIKELAEVIHKDYPEVNAEHIATIAVEWFNDEKIYLVQEQTSSVKGDTITWLVGFDLNGKNK